MRSALTRLALGALVGLAAARAGADLTAGTMLDSTTAEQAKDLLPPEILRHYRNGDYRNKVVEFPITRWRWDDGFEEATRWNGEHLVLDEHKAPVDKTTGKRPDYISGVPFPDIREDDPDAGYKVLWNVDYAYYTGGNSRNLVLLSWVSRSGLDRSAVQDVRFLYYDGQPRKYAPAANPDNFLFQFLALSTSPADLQGTAALGYRYKDPTKRDMNWACGRCRPPIAPTASSAPTRARTTASSSTASPRTSPGRSPATRRDSASSTRTASRARWCGTRSRPAGGARSRSTTTAPPASR
ncbi:MAG: DUF1329 domain-containing protein [Deltaproteobacteria bacterium]|nr:MAG: DUF1329 domain-containing protein [Deltaproteobacteria bacterium]